MPNAVTIRIDADAARAISQINATALSLDRLDGSGRKAGASLQNTGRTLTRTGSTMTRQLTVPIALAGGAAVKTAIDFDQSMNRIQALVGASTGQVEKFSKAILNLAPTVGKSPKELADALYFITSSGFSGAKALDVLTISAKASASGLGDTQTVADAVTSAVNAYGQNVLSAASATDVLTATVREGKGEPTELAAALGQVVAPAQALGVSFDQVGGALSSLTLLGLDASESATALRGQFTALLKPSAAAVKVLDQAGLSAAELRNQVRDKGLLPTLQALRDRFGDNQETLAKLFPNVRALNGFLILTGKNAENNQRIFDKVAKSQGDTAAAFEKTGQAARQQLNESLAELQVTGVKLGNDLVPILVDVAGGVATVTDGFSQLSPGMQHFIEIAVGGVAVLGPLTSAVGNIALVAGKTSEGLATLATRIGVTSGVLGVGLVGAAALAVTGIYLLATANSTAGESFNRLTDSANAAGDAIRGSSVANVDAKQAALDLKEANIAVRNAQGRVNDLIDGGKRGTKEYGQALRDLERAQLAQQRAAIRNTDAAEAQAAAHKQARDAIQSVRSQMRTLSTATHRATGDSRLNATAVAAAKKGYDDLIGSLAGAAEKARNGTRAQQQTIANMQREASATRALIDALNAIPSQKTVDIFIKQTTQLTTIETNRTNRFHAIGGITRRQITLPSSDTYGEPSTGGEAILPLKSAGGREALATAVATAMKTAGVSGGGGIHVEKVVIVAREYDAKKLERDLSRIRARRA